MQHAGVAVRFVAVLIDSVIVIVVAIVVSLLAGGYTTYQSTTSDGTIVAGVDIAPSPLWLALGFFGYYVVYEAVFGRTIGKRCVGLRIVDEDGDPIGWSASVIRNLFRILDGLLFYLVAAIAVSSSRTKQRLGDRAAGSFVVHS